MPMSAKPKIFALAACLVAAAAGISFRGANDEPAPSTWNKQAAASYLDARQTWWMHWPKAARDHETFCVSCHTVVPKRSVALAEFPIAALGGRGLAILRRHARGYSYCHCSRRLSLVAAHSTELAVASRVPAARLRSAISEQSRHTPVGVHETPRHSDARAAT